MTPAKSKNMPTRGKVGSALDVTKADLAIGFARAERDFVVGMLNDVIAKVESNPRTRGLEGLFIAFRDNYAKSFDQRARDLRKRGRR